MSAGSRTTPVDDRGLEEWVGFVGEGGAGVLHVSNRGRVD